MYSLGCLASRVWKQAGCHAEQASPCIIFSEGEKTLREWRQERSEVSAMQEWNRRAHPEEDRQREKAVEKRDSSCNRQRERDRSGVERRLLDSNGRKRITREKRST